jgi:hypothetical protein
MIYYKLIAEEIPDALPDANRKVLSQHLHKDFAYSELIRGKYKIVTWGFDYVRYYFEYKPGCWQNVIVEEGDYEYEY